MLGHDFLQLLNRIIIFFQTRVGEICRWVCRQSGISRYVPRESDQTCHLFQGVQFLHESPFWLVAFAQVG